MISTDSPTKDTEETDSHATSSRPNPDTHLGRVNCQQEDEENHNVNDESNQVLGCYPGTAF